MHYFLNSLVMRMRTKCFLPMFLMSTLFAVGCATVAPVTKGSISLVEQGLLKANTGEERYNILLKTHKLALERGAKVDYRGLKRIDITIPTNASSIPLGAVNDFENVVFNVTNNSKDFYLFAYTNKAVAVEVNGYAIDRGVFGSVTQLRTGQKVLSIEDKNPWVANRKSYSYGHQRKDVLLLVNGNAKNSPVMPYGNAQSTPVCKYYSVEHPYFQFSGITLNRVAGSTSKTYLCRIIGTNDVRLKDVVLNTPQDDMVSDAAISIIDCTNVSFENVTVNGTYSRTNYAGYGISMNNVWNFKAKNLRAIGNWGVFGNNNINTALIENSEINRFDIHCYGRDVSFKDVVFVNLYNQFSSTFGTIRFDRCTFNHFTPVLYEASYNSYTPHNLVFNDCVFHLTKKRNYLVSAGRLTPEENARAELKDKCWPNVTINRMKVVVDEEADAFHVFSVNIDPKFEGSVHSVEDIIINGLTFEYGNSTKAIPMNIVNRNVTTANPLNVKVSDLKTMPGVKLNLNINKGSKRNTVSVRRSTVNGVVQ